MSTKTTKCALFLSPKKTDVNITDSERFITRLQEIGLIAKEISDQNNVFYTGKRYLDYISYMGCSPAIQFEPDKTSDNFCQVKVHCYERKKLIVSKLQARAPHCPNCRKPAKDWSDNKTEETINCKFCNTTSNIGEFDWRRMGGYARVFIEITDIYPKEAIPQQILLDELNNICEADWSFFYSCI